LDLVEKLKNELHNFYPLEPADMRLYLELKDGDGNPAWIVLLIILFLID